MDFAVTVVASDFEVVEAFRVGFVCDLGVCFRVLVAKDAIAVVVLSCACLWGDRSSGWLGGGGIRLVIALAHKELTVVTRRGLRRRSGARGTNRLGAVIFAGG